MNDYEKLEESTIQYFCKESDDVNPTGRVAAAVYIDDNHYDAEYSMPALGANQDVLQILKELPEDEVVSHQHNKPVRRWETFRTNFSSVAVTTILEQGQWKGTLSASSKSKKKTVLKVEDLKKRRSALSKQGVKFTSKDHPPLNKIHKEYWDEVLTEAEQGLVVDNSEDSSDSSDSAEVDTDNEEAESESENLSGGGGFVGTYKFEDIFTEKTLLEPYYRLAWRSQDWAKASSFPRYKYGSKHRMCNQQERPDLILEVGYFSSDSGLFTKRVILCEIDGEDKTSSSKKISADDDDSVPARKPKDDPIKLALKLMSSTFAQNVLQQQTYHIRANYVWYFDRLIDKSLLSTTSLELPEIADLITNAFVQQRYEVTQLHNIASRHSLHTSHVYCARENSIFDLYASCAQCRHAEHGPDRPADVQSQFLR